MSQFAKRINVSNSTLRRWDGSGEFPAKRRPSSYRCFDENDVRKALNLAPDEFRRVIAYCRVSSHGQKNDLESQIRAMETYCLGAGNSVDEWIRKIGGGMNFKRKKFRTFIDAIVVGEVKHLIIAHKERLMRFGSDLFQHLSERHDSKIKAIDQETLSPHEKMTEDLLTIVHTSRCRLYGMRKYHKKQAGDGIRKVIVE